MNGDFELENLFKEAERTVDEIAKKKKRRMEGNKPFKSELEEASDLNSLRNKDKESLIREIERLNEKIADMGEEFSNFKKRNLREREKLTTYIEAELLKEIITIVDIFDYANKTFSRDAAHTVEDYKKGFHLLYREFMTLLNKIGLERIKAVGERFDPNFHHVVAVQEVENMEENIILDEIKSGYIYKGIVIRPSMVKVAKRKK